MHKLIPLLTRLVPVLKEFILPNGKFNPLRVLLILVSFAMVLVTVDYYGYETVEQSIDLLDELVDSFGSG